MRIIIIAITCSLLSLCVVSAEDKIMKDEDVQKTWNEYHEKIKNRRLSEARIINIEW